MIGVGALMLVCSCCERPCDNIAIGRCLGCGACAWRRVETGKRAKRPKGDAQPEREKGSRNGPVWVRSLAKTERVEVDHYAGELSAAMNGIKRGCVVLISGPRGAGKSTLSAELACAIRRRRGGLVWWLDKDQADDGLVLELFHRVGEPAPAKSVRVVSPLPRDDPQYVPIGWREALDAVPAEAPVVVLDSLQKWAAGLNDQDRLTDALLHDPYTKRGRIILVISRTNAKGEAFGHQSAQFDADAVVSIRPDVIEVEKSRWTPRCPFEVPRAARELPGEVMVH
jgi:energy-coupling factor transporter ATP-binding protein EcfA2